MIASIDLQVAKDRGLKLKAADCLSSQISFSNGSQCSKGIRVAAKTIKMPPIVPDF